MPSSFECELRMSGLVSPPFGIWIQVLLLHTAKALIAGG